MKIRLKIQQKIQLFIITASILIYLISVGYITFNARKMAYADATNATNSYVLNAASQIADKFNSDMAIAKTLADAFQIFDQYDKAEWQNLINKMYLNVFNSNPHIYAIWDSWELNAIDKTYTKDYGRIANTYWRVNGAIKSNIEYRSMDGDSELYLETKSSLIPSISEPYLDAATQGKQEKLLMTSLNAPIVKKNKYQAVVSLDVTLKQIQEIISEIKPYEGSYALMVSNKGLIAGHPDSEVLTKTIAELFPFDEKTENVSTRIEKGDFFNYITTNEKGEEVYVSYAPILVNDTNTPWSIALSVPVKSMMAVATNNFRVSVLVGILGLILMALIIFIIGKNIAKPIVKITHLLKQLAVGNIDDSMKVHLNSGDELEEMTESANMVIDGLGKTADFARTIGKGNLNAAYEKAGEKDVLGEALLEMRRSLVLAEEEESKRKIEDDKNNWATQGLAKFGDILRQHNQDIQELSFNIMSNLVDYVEAIQGALFVKNDDNEDEEFFELTGAIAYNRQKLLDRKFNIGEGLVGRCAYEKLTIYMEEVPNDYVNVTSGLGESNPRSILLVPAILNDEVYAIIELVSFNKFEDYQIQFVEKIGESIASTISNARINERTNKLLSQSKMQAEELAAQEEEMRQNLEELQATQEEVGRLREEDQLKNQQMLEDVEKHKSTLLKILDHIPVKVFLKDSEGKMVIVNKKILEVHQTSLEDIIGKSDFDFFADNYEKAKKLWDAEQELIRTGQPKKEVYEELVNNSGVVLDSTIYPFYIDYLGETGILGVQVDITELTKKEEYIQKLEEELRKYKG